MASPIACSISAILLAIKAQLASQLPLLGIMEALAENPDLVRIVAQSAPPRFQADQEVLLRPAAIEWDAGFNVGSGRLCQIARRQILVQPRTRLNLDTSDSDASRLLDPQLGQIALEEAIVNVLLNFIPQDLSGNWLTQEPLYASTFPQEERQEEAAADWVESYLSFTAAYQIPLTLTGPGY